MANPVFSTFAGLRGNQKACVYTEPLWGLSMNLCLPYASVYMLALGLNDAEVGFVATIYMISQAVFAFLGGPITDKMGRRKATAVWDFISWCVPCLIWWRAENFWFFLVAAIINGSMKVTHNSWNCLLVEDTEKGEITNLYSLVIVCGQLCAFFAPISSIMVSRLTLIPAIRILYINAFVLMTLKLVILYIFSAETKIGRRKIEESRGKSIMALAGSYGGVIKIILKSRGTLFSLFIFSITGIVGLLNSTFWQVIASKKILVPDPFLPLFPVIRSILSIFFLFFVLPRLSNTHLKAPLLLGLVCYVIGQFILIQVPSEGALRYPLLSLSLIFDGFGFGAMTMLAESLIALNISVTERAKVMAILHLIAMTATSPFGWIGGLLSGISRNLPFILNIFLLASCVIVTLIYYGKKHDAEAVIEPQG